MLMEMSEEKIKKMERNNCFDMPYASSHIIPDVNSKTY